MRELKIFVLIAAFAVFAACSQNATNGTSNATAANSKANNAATPAPAATGEVATGAKLYGTSCAKCHKDDGSGGKITVDGKTINPDNLTTPKIAAKTDDKMLSYIVDGFPEDGMPAFKDKLKEDEMKKIIAFIRSDLQKGGSKPAPVQPN